MGRFVPLRTSERGTEHPIQCPSRCGSLLPSASADVRSSGDVIASWQARGSKHHDATEWIQPADRDGDHHQARGAVDDYFPLQVHLYPQPDGGCGGPGVVGCWRRASGGAVVGCWRQLAGCFGVIYTCKQVGVAKVVGYVCLFVCFIFEVFCLFSNRSPSLPPSLPSPPFSAPTPHF